MTTLSSAVAFGLVTLAITNHNARFDPLSLALVLAALAVSLAGVRRRPSPDRDARAARVTPRLLAAMTAASFMTLLVRQPVRYLEAGVSLAPFRAGVAIAAVVALTWALGRAPAWLRRARVPALIACYLALGAWAIRASPAPEIDVWHFQQRAAELLLNGQNPWAADYPNIYGHTHYVGGALLTERGIQSYPYPPLSLLLTVPGALAGDVRWSLLAAVALAAACGLAAARRLGLPPGHAHELGLVLLLFHPRAFFLIEQAWTEPFIALAAAATLWALAAGRRFTTGAAIAALFSAKQYGVFLLPALWRQARAGGPAVVIGLTLVAAVTVPFLMWDPAALWRGVVSYQIAQPFRMDALTVPALWVRLTGTAPTEILPFVTAGVAALICGWRAPRDATGSPGAMALAGAATCLAFFAFSKQAFFNYYWFTGALLALGTTLGTLGPPGSGPAIEHRDNRSVPSA